MWKAPNILVEIALYIEVLKPAAFLSFADIALMVF